MEIRSNIRRDEMNDLVKRAGLENAYVREIAFTPESLRVELLVADKNGSIVVVLGNDGPETVSAWCEIPYADETVIRTGP